MVSQHFFLLGESSVRQTRQRCVIDNMELVLTVVSSNVYYSTSQTLIHKHNRLHILANYFMCTVPNYVHRSVSTTDNYCGETWLQSLPRQLPRTDQATDWMWVWPCASFTAVTVRTMSLGSVGSSHTTWESMFKNGISSGSRWWLFKTSVVIPNRWLLICTN